MKSLSPAAEITKKVLERGVLSFAIIFLALLFGTIIISLDPNGWTPAVIIGASTITLGMVFGIVYFVLRSLTESYQSVINKYEGYIDNAQIHNNKIYEFYQSFTADVLHKFSALLNQSFDFSDKLKEDSVTRMTQQREERTASTSDSIKSSEKRITDDGGEAQNQGMYISA